MKKNKNLDLIFFSKKKHTQIFFWEIVKNKDFDENQKFGLFYSEYRLNKKKHRKNFAIFSTKFFAKFCKIPKRSYLP